jgi:Rrf2 family protein
MKLSRASTYALQAVVGMSGQQDGQVVGSHLTAQAHGLSGKFLLRLLLSLVRAEILYSRKGPNGGYRLAKCATKITLLDIIEAVDGPLRGEVPASEVKGEQRLIARLGEVCQRITDHDRRELGKVTVADLAKAGNINSP